MTPAEIQAWLTTVVRPLVNAPEAVTVIAPDRAGAGVLLELRADEADLGRLIGHDGVTINSLRHLVQAVGARHGVSVFVDVPQTRRGHQRRSQDPA